MFPIGIALLFDWTPLAASIAEPEPPGVAASHAIFEDTAQGILGD